MSDQAVREHLLYLLGGGGAHLDFERAIADLPDHLRGAKVPNVPHTPWRLLEHMRICQWDILEFSRNPRHVSPEFPHGYWPEGDAPPDWSAWDNSVAAFRADLQAMMDLVAARDTDLYARIPHGDGQTILREALLVADHNAYHLGQFVFLRRCLGAWNDGCATMDEQRWMSPVDRLRASEGTPCTSVRRVCQSPPHRHGHLGIKTGPLEAEMDDVRC